MMDLTISRRIVQLAPDIEVVERKGRGHPDTLSDGLAEHLSSNYCRYTIEEFGSILNHNFDKVGLLGGQSEAKLGKGRMLRPVRVLLNGRAADGFAGQDIPLRMLLIGWATEFLVRELPRLDAERDLEFHFNVSSANTPGYPSNDFAPGGDSDLRQLQELRSSDTAVVCAQYPPTALEAAVLAIEEMLTSDPLRQRWPWIGSDIKVLAWRSGNTVSMTACVPEIADEVADLEAYRANLAEVRNLVEQKTAEVLPGHHVELHLNTLDDEAGESLYLTVVGSCVESGDEGLVGRGNRPSGVIAPLRPHSGEAACGKNPAFFPGKIYNAAAAEIARLLHDETGHVIEVWLTAQEGRPIDDPWQVVVFHDGEPLPGKDVERVVHEVLGRLPDLTEAMINGEIRLW